MNPSGDNSPARPAALCAEPSLHSRASARIGLRGDAAGVLGAAGRDQLLCDRNAIVHNQVMHHHPLCTLTTKIAERKSVSPIWKSCSHQKSSFSKSGSPPPLLFLECLGFCVFGTPQHGKSHAGATPEQPLSTNFGQIDCPKTPPCVQDREGSKHTQTVRATRTAVVVDCVGLAEPVD